MGLQWEILARKKGTRGDVIFTQWPILVTIPSSCVQAGMIMEGTFHLLTYASFRGADI